MKKYIITTWHRFMNWLRGVDTLPAEVPAPLSRDESRMLHHAELMALQEMLKEHKFERFWRGVRRLTVTVVVIVVILTSLVGYINQYGFAPSFSKPYVGVVKIDGAIGSKVTDEAVIPALRRAFKAKTSFVVLQIDSPGGSPSTAESIIREMEILKKETGKKVVAVIGGIGASAGYMIAAHCDEVVAGRYSLIGSIGAIMTSWNASALPPKVDVEQMMFASGELKGMLNPWKSPTEKDRAKAQALVDELARVFIEDIKSQRGAKLNAEGVNLFTGETWAGDQALKFGLIDRIGTLSDVVAPTQALPQDFGPHKKNGMSDILGEAAKSMVEGAYDAIKIKLSNESATIH